MPTFEGPASGTLLYLGERMHRILLADSDPATRDLLCLRLRQYEIVYAPTAARALALAQRKRPCLAVLECLLRDMSGLELLKKLRAIAPAIPAVMIAPDVYSWMRAPVLAAGARAFLTKPLEIDVLWCLIERELRPGLTDEAEARTSASADQALIEQVKSYIEEHYSEALSLTQWSQRLGVSRFALYRKLKAVEGVSFRDYLLHVRLTKALELLSTGQYPVTEVAQMVGFSDLPRFDKVFKRAAGSPPSAFRNLTLADAFFGRRLGCNRASTILPARIAIKRQVLRQNY